MSATLALREFHAFDAFDARFLYLVPSAGIFRLDDVASAALDTLASGPRARDEVVRELAARFGTERTLETLDELAEVRAIGDPGAPRRQVPNDLPPADFPLNTLA
jgi:hypothetical protein